MWGAMLEIQHIIVPVDFQEHTEELTEFAISLASRLAAKITFFHVVENVVYYSDFIPTYMHLNTEETLKHAKMKMIDLVENSKNTWLRCTGEVIVGDVVDNILEYSQKEGIDMIIMGTHGARGIEKILLGSVADRVIKRSTCPTLVYRPKIK
jgi:nucleotide-binding universal stress UspA family protein